MLFLEIFKMNEILCAQILLILYVFPIFTQNLHIIPLKCNTLLVDAYNFTYHKIQRRLFFWFKIFI
jgi:hypothetical protein